MKFEARKETWIHEHILLVRYAAMKVLVFQQQKIKKKSIKIPKQPHITK